ncbi:MAG: septum formation initiator family protein [Candidatus Zixiibacteriota bacterium]
MPRKARQKKPSLLAPAGSLLKRLSNADSRFRRRVLQIGLWAMAALFAYGLFIGTYSVPRIIRLNIKKQALLETNRHLAADLVDAVRVSDMLTHDSTYIEQVARTRYYMVRPNEIIYRFRSR